MAWNGSSIDNTKASASSAPKRKAPSLIRGYVAGGIVILVCVLALYFINGDREEPTPVAKEKGPIAEVTPELPAPKTNVPVTKVVEKEDRNSLEWLKKHDPRYIVPEGAVRRENGRLYTKEGRRILEDLPARVLEANAGQKQVFRHSAENAIARVLSMEPGKVFIGNGNYGPAFVRSLKEALVSPTLPDKDDDDATRELKHQVCEVMGEFKSRMEAGEDVGKVMREAEGELRALATYRQNVMQSVVAARYDENYSEQDYADYVEAANKLLKDHGLNGLSLPSLAEGQLKYLRAAQKARQAANGSLGNNSK